MFFSQSFNRQIEDCLASILFILSSFVLIRPKTSLAIGGVLFHLMSQKVSISSSESLNNTKLFPFHLLCHFEIRHTLKLNSPPSLWGFKPIYFQCVERFLASFAFFFSFSLQQWFHWDQFAHITSVPLFFFFYKKCSFALTAVWLGKVFHLWVLTLQNLFYTGFPHPATSPSWTAKSEPCEFVWSAVNIDGTLYDAMGKDVHKNIMSWLTACIPEPWNIYFLKTREYIS